MIKQEMSSADISNCCLGGKYNKEDSDHCERLFVETALWSIMPFKTPHHVTA
jgi:hypothetical protein